MLILRGHHLICLQSFQGFGYSKEFTKNMNEIIKSFHEPGSLIRLVAEVDSICGKCPHKRGHVCDKEEEGESKVKAMDRRILAFLELREGERYTNLEIMQKIRSKLQASDLDYLCENCSWLKDDYCKKGIEKLIKGNELA